MSQLTAIATLVAANIGRQITQTTPNGEKTFAISRLADNKGKMADGSKAEYVIITNVADESVVIKLHPNVVDRLFRETTFDGFTLMPVNGAVDEAADPSTQTDVNTELEAASNEGTADAVIEDPTTTATEVATLPTEGVVDAETVIASGADANMPAVIETTPATAAVVETTPATAAVVEAPTMTKEQREAKKAQEKADRKAAREQEFAARREAKVALEKKAAAERAAAKGPTTKEKAMAIFVSVSATNADGTKNTDRRKQVIGQYRKLVSEGGLGMSENGANTYYQNFANGDWKEAADQLRAKIAAEAAKTTT